MLQAYLPDALSAVPASDRVGAGSRRGRRGADQGARRQGRQPRDGARRRDACTAGRWRPTPSKRDTDTNYKRVLNWAMRPEHTAARADRRRRAQPVRHRLRPPAGAQRGVRGCRRVRDAPRHGRGPGRCRARGRRRPPAVHAGRAARRSSTSRSATWSAASRRTRARRTSCRPCSRSPATRCS